MGSSTSDGYLWFTAVDTGTTLISPSRFSADPQTLEVYDNGTGVGDGNADTSTDYFHASSIPYTGYTIHINGNDYAIFLSGGIYYVPFFNSVEDLAASVRDELVSGYTISQSGENAVVANLCFVGGTLIATPDGERLVEDLAIGDLVRTADGRDVPVKWVGRQHISRPANVLHFERLAPVCITAGALGNHSDLYVSADHGMIVSPSSSKAVGDQKDDLVINAAALVNGDTIRFVPPAEMPAKFTYYHIETEAHDVILANGAPSETFVDAVTRSHFDNYAEYLDLYGAERIIPEMPRKRITSARLVPSKIRYRLDGVAEKDARKAMPNAV